MLLQEIASIHLGFETVGMLKEVGFKFGRMLDVCIMELVL